jgi:hypothetical protein
VASASAALLQVATGEPLQHLPASLRELQLSVAPGGDEGPMLLGHLTGNALCLAAAAADANGSAPASVLRGQDAKFHADDDESTSYDIACVWVYIGHLK